MSKSDLSFYIALISIAAVLTGGQMAWSLYDQLRDHERNSISTSGSDPAILQVTAPGYAATSSAYEKYRIEEQDLAAQQDMARWALWMVIVSAAGVMVSGLAVLLIRETLRETRLGVLAAERAAQEAAKANSEFVKASAQQLTAYVIAEDFELIQSFDGNGKCSISWCVALRNAGQTPAFDARGFVVCEWATAQEARSWELPVGDGGGVIGPARKQVVTGKFKPDYSDVDLHAEQMGGRTIWMKGVMVYKDINEQTWRHEFLWLVDKKQEDLLTIPAEATSRTVRFRPHVRGNELRIVAAPES